MPHRHRERGVADEQRAPLADPEDLLDQLVLARHAAPLFESRKRLRVLRQGVRVGRRLEYSAPTKNKLDFCFVRRRPLHHSIAVHALPCMLPGMFGEHDGERVCDAGLRRVVRSRPI